MYKISFYGKRYKTKPQGKEIAYINKKLSTVEMTHDYIANLVGENGCTFSPAIFYDKRNANNFLEQQLIVLDFDDGVSFSEIKCRANRYGLPILLAYKSFSWTPEHEKFRVVFAMDRPITDRFTAESVTAIFMKIFSEADKSCKDSARMFFGGMGLLYLVAIPHSIALSQIAVTFSEYMADRYDRNHYRKYIKEFYSGIGVEVNKTVPIIENGVIKRSYQITTKNSNETIVKKSKRKVTRNFSFDTLYERCKLYRDFVDGTEYYYYNDLFHIATNLINIENGKKEFLRILKIPENAKYEAYHNRNWNVILNALIALDYKPSACSGCPYADTCNHQKNMILTAKPGKSCIRLIEPKEYYTLEEAETSLRDNFIKAVKSEQWGIHIVIAQTGIGKTHMYLNHLLTANKKYIIAVPTHKLKDEIYIKALKMGIKDIVRTPEFPKFINKDIELQIRHTYDVGAGAVNLEAMREILDNMKRSDPDYDTLKGYLNEVSGTISFDGHIITTHERLLYLNRDSPVLKNHEVIIDEDILRTAIATNTVDNTDIEIAMQCDCFGRKSKERMTEILSYEGYHTFSDTAGVTINRELLYELNDINSNVLDLLHAKAVYNNGERTIYTKEKRFPFRKAIVMSATVNPEIYKMLLNMPVYEYRCKQAKYEGKLKIYPKYTFSRHSLGNDEEVMNYLKENLNSGAVITFLRFEQMFGTEYHFGAVEGINSLEGKDINVIGLPNCDESVYKLYGILAGVAPYGNDMRPMRIQYNGYEFWLNTFANYRLRTIQLWNLESLLEQAVGRARLLRNDCEVRVFARFPIDQAEIIS